MLNKKRNHSSNEKGSNVSNKLTDVFKGIPFNTVTLY